LNIKEEFNYSPFLFLFLLIVSLTSLAVSFIPLPTVLITSVTTGSTLLKVSSSNIPSLVKASLTLSNFLYSSGCNNPVFSELYPCATKSSN
jgi:hypothetical protein